MSLRSRKLSNLKPTIELQLENLKEENGKLRDSLVLQRRALEEERREKECYIVKYHQLEKEKQEAVERYQGLLMKLVGGDVLGLGKEETGFGRLFMGLERQTEGERDKEERRLSSRISKRDSRLSQEDSMQQSQMLSKLLQHNIKSINQKEQSLERTKERLVQLRQQPGKLITLREINGASVEYKKEQRIRQPLAQSRRRLSYFQKLRLNNA